MTLYADRTLWELEPHYSAHVSAMTTEGLCTKSGIAAELAWRDQQLEEQKAVIEAAQDWKTVMDDNDQISLPLAIAALWAAVAALKEKKQ